MKDVISDVPGCAGGSSAEVVLQILELVESAWIGVGSDWRRLHHHRQFGTNESARRWPSGGEEQFSKNCYRASIVWCNGQRARVGHLFADAGCHLCTRSTAARKMWSLEEFRI
ncbi:hypothetical protein EVAR_97801_1 [Eumeta japonica]|uniref:Uncharacterized protein n=1 Tax=Eumeta variegata TaxID=151549 RepID=A0A4C1X9U9_EUMVA|nr:hypothetical protein EVAR_97801_1 [Eumeta japonica]